MFIDVKIVRLIRKLTMQWISLRRTENTGPQAHTLMKGNLTELKQPAVLTSSYLVARDGLDRDLVMLQYPSPEHVVFFFNLA